MDTRSLAHPAHPPTREERALELYRTRGHEIRHVTADNYLVPACSGRGFYAVRYGGDVESCDCPDFEFGRGGRSCKHLLAVGIYHAKHRIRPEVLAGDPFAYAGERPHGCIDGWVYLGFEGEDENGEHVEEIERVPCGRCNDGDGTAE